MKDLQTRKKNLGKRVLVLLVLILVFIHKQGYDHLPDEKHLVLCGSVAVHLRVQARATSKTSTDTTSTNTSINT